MTSEACLKLELSEAQNEIQRFKDRLATAPPTVYNDLTLVSLVPKWSGSGISHLTGIFLQYRRLSEDMALGGG